MRASQNQLSHFKSHHKITLAAPFSAALARELKTALLTGDPNLSRLEKEIKINCLNPEI